MYVIVYPMRDGLFIIIYFKSLHFLQKFGCAKVDIIKKGAVICLPTFLKKSHLAQL